MASLATRNDIYYIDFYDSTREPRRKRLSLKTTSEAVAERLKVELEDALYTGLRLRELARLRRRDVDTSQGLIYLHRQKSGKGGTAPLARKAAAVLEVGDEDVAPEGYVFTSPEGDRCDRSEDAWCDTVTCAFARYREAAGLKESYLSQPAP